MEDQVKAALIAIAEMPAGFWIVGAIVVLAVTVFVWGLLATRQQPQQVSQPQRRNGSSPLGRKAKGLLADDVEAFDGYAEGEEVPPLRNFKGKSWE